MPFGDCDQYAMALSAVVYAGSQHGIGGMRPFW